MTNVLQCIDQNLEAENLSSMAAELGTAENQGTSAFLDASDIDLMLDSDERMQQPQAEKRKLPGYRKVNHNLNDVFDFSVFLQRCKEVYNLDS